MALSLVLVPVALAVALRFGLFDHPGPAKSHTEAVPYLGGAAIVVSFALVVVVGNVVDPPPSGCTSSRLPRARGPARRGGARGRPRQGPQPLAATCPRNRGRRRRVGLGHLPHLAGVPQPVNALITVVWVVGITNAFNLLDNMDGLSAGMAVIAALAIFGVALLQQRYLVSALALALAGCAAGFLRANFHPAKIYMGDAGSLFLGFVLAVLLLKLRGNAPTRVPVAVILAIPGVAIFDTTLVMVSRLAHRRSPFQGGQDHTSHRLVRLGMSVPVAVTTIYAAGSSSPAPLCSWPSWGRPCASPASSGCWQLRGSPRCHWPGCPFTALRLALQPFRKPVSWRRRLRRSRTKGGSDLAVRSASSFRRPVQQGAAKRYDISTPHAYS